MTTSGWISVAGLAMSALLALGPWMFMVHAKLAVIASQIVDLSQKLEKAAEATERLWSLYAQHEARLETHDAHLTHVAERLRDMEQETRD